MLDFGGWWRAKATRHQFPGASPPDSWTWPCVVVLVASLATIVVCAIPRDAWQIIPVSIGSMVFGQAAMGLNLSFRGHLLNVADTLAIGAVGALTAPLVAVVGVDPVAWMVLTIAFAILTCPILGFIWSVTLYARDETEVVFPWDLVPRALAGDGSHRVVRIEERDDEEMVVSVMGPSSERTRVPQGLVGHVEIGSHVLLLDVQKEIEEGAHYRDRATTLLTAESVHELGRSLTVVVRRKAWRAGVVVLVTWHVLFFGLLTTVALLTGLQNMF